MTIHAAEDQQWSCRHDYAVGMMPMMIRIKSVFGLLLMIGMMPSQVRVITHS
ncbi:hypothetical protein [Mesorhizobium sp.]|uniref:hypothetical protein n=1 Tax=Mesorhizobium sp. TaxID=1871066 RepID=UPI0025F7B1E7|nr:hypothetical protein [Mesorhizobium sp.]